MSEWGLMYGHDDLVTVENLNGKFCSFYVVLALVKKGQTRLMWKEAWQLKWLQIPRMYFTHQYIFIWLHFLDLCCKID